jgi:hypothetical protein
VMATGPLTFDVDTGADLLAAEAAVQPPASAGARSGGGRDAA